MLNASIARREEKVNLKNDLFVGRKNIHKVPADNNTAMVHYLVPQQDEMMTSRVLSSSSLGKK